MSTTFDLRREVNEQIYALLLRSSIPSRPSDRMDALCECDDPCLATLTVKLRTYERVRSHDGLRLVLPEHACDGTEIRRTRSFKIVQVG